MASKARPSHVALTLGFVALALLVAISFGFDYGTGNQPTYLLGGLRLINHDVLARDWLASETYAYHPAFGWVVWLAALAGPLPWTLTILNTLLVAGALFGLKWLIQQIEEDGIWLTSLLVLCVVAIDQTFSVAGSYIFGHSLQPSTLAGIAFIVAVGGFLAGRWLLSGVALAVAGVFHINYLVLGIAVFALAHLLLGTRTLVKRCSLQLGAALIVLAANMPVLLDVASAPGAKEAAHIFMSIRSPHHYLPQRFFVQLVLFLAWQVAALALWRDADVVVATSHRLRALWAALAVPVVAATVINTVILIPQLSQLFVWRMAPFAVLLAQIVTCSACVQIILHPGRNTGEPRRMFGARRAIAVAAVGVVIAYRLTHHADGFGGIPIPSLALAGLFIACTGAVAAARWMPSILVRRCLAAAALVGLAAATRGRLRDAYQSSTVIRGEGVLPEAGLYRWARATRPTTLFLIPPDLGAFRLRTLRAVVVDWKSTPVRPDELIQWYKRIEAIAGRPVYSLRDATQGYAASNSARAMGLRRRYGIDYMVVRRRNAKAICRLAGRFPTVYADSTYLVLDLRAGIQSTLKPAAAGGPSAIAAPPIARSSPKS